MHRIVAAAGLNPGPYMGQYMAVDSSDQFVVRADHNPNILLMHGEAVVPNKRAVATVVGHRAGNSATVGFREDPNRWGGSFGSIRCGEAADHRVENPVDRGCPEGPTWLHAVVGQAGRDITAAQAEEGRTDDDDS